MIVHRIPSCVMDRNANPYSELFYHCVQVLNEYPATVSEEVFLAEYFAKNQVKTNGRRKFLGESKNEISIFYSLRFRTNRSSQRFYSIVFDMRHFSERSMKFSMKPTVFAFYEPKKISTKVFFLAVFLFAFDFDSDFQ